MSWAPECGMPFWRMFSHVGRPLDLIATHSFQLDDIPPGSRARVTCHHHLDCLDCESLNRHLSHVQRKKQGPDTSSSIAETTESNLSKSESSTPEAKVLQIPRIGSVSVYVVHT